MTSEVHQEIVAVFRASVYSDCDSVNTNRDSSASDRFEVVIVTAKAKT